MSRRAAQGNSYAALRLNPAQARLRNLTERSVSETADTVKPRGGRSTSQSFVTSAVNARTSPYTPNPSADRQRMVNMTAFKRSATGAVDFSVEGSPSTTWLQS